jgi:hypothetical protein
MMKILIMSDGTPTGTRVTDEFHKPIGGVVAVCFFHHLGKTPEINLTLNTAMVGMAAQIDALPPVPEAPAPAPTPAKEKPKNEKRTASK